MKQLNCLPIIFDCSNGCYNEEEVTREEVLELCKTKYEQVKAGIDIILQSVTDSYPGPLDDYLNDYLVQAMTRLIEFGRAIERYNEFDYRIIDIDEEVDE